MGCTKGYVTTGASQPDINTCVSTDSMNVYVTLEGVKGETWPFEGYVKFVLYRESSNADAWTHVSTLNGGLWSNSTTTKKNITFKNIGQPGKTMKVEALFYSNSNYTGKCDSDATHTFLR